MEMEMEVCLETLMSRIRREGAGADGLERKSRLAV